MLRPLVFLIFGLYMFLLAGCWSNSTVESEGGVDVYVDGDGQFPEYLVGRWKSDQGGWEIEFEQNGTISSAIISLGRVTIQPGRVTTVPMISGGEGVFVPGNWIVQCMQEQRQLIVEIVIDRFSTELGENIVYGKSRDFFVGQVSKDGTLWQAERYSYPEYFVDTDKYHNYLLPVDPNENPRETLLFQKVPSKE